MEYVVADRGQYHVGVVRRPLEFIALRRSAKAFDGMVLRSYHLMSQAVLARTSGRSIVSPSIGDGPYVLLAFDMMLCFQKSMLFCTKPRARWTSRSHAGCRGRRHARPALDLYLQIPDGRRPCRPVTPLYDRRGHVQHTGNPATGQSARAAHLRAQPLIRGRIRITMR